VTAPISGAGGTPPGGDDPKRAGAKQAAAGLEAFFLRQLLAEAKKSSNDPLMGGFAGDTFKDMLDTQLADSMAGAGGIGLAGVFERQLGGEPVMPPGTPGTPGAPGALHATRSYMPMAPTAPGAPTSIDVGAADDHARFILPVHGRPTSGFGDRVDPINHTVSRHPGFDLAAPTGTPVGAAAAGKVVRAGAAGTYGNLVVIRHADGLETRYAHLSRVDVKVGDEVPQGAQIGAVGTTGRSTGPHLHFEVREAGEAIDPRPLLPQVKRP
jgi:murein DD-endopeptidase MepM/ murein hydrolase activator NlpD